MTENKVISILNPDQVWDKGGLPVKTICGHFVENKLSPEDFIPNQQFIDLLHFTIRSHAYKLESMKQSAKKQNNGYIYIIDLRTPDGIMGNVPPEDIIGAYSVKNGELIIDSYIPNDNYKVFTKSGLIKLPKDLYDKLIEEIKK